MKSYKEYISEAVATDSSYALKKIYSGLEDVEELITKVEKNIDGAKIKEGLNAPEARFMNSYINELRKAAKDLTKALYKAMSATTEGK